MFWGVLYLWEGAYIRNLFFDSISVDLYTFLLVFWSSYARSFTALILFTLDFLENLNRKNKMSPSLFCNTAE